MHGWSCSVSDSLEQKKKAAGKSAVWYTLSTFITKGLGFLTIPLFTRVMTTGEFGLFNNFAAWQVILLSVLSLESYATLNRARLDYYGKDLQDYQFTLLTSSLGVTMLLVILLVCAPTIPETITDLDRRYLYIMVLYLLFYPAFTMFQMLQRVQYRYKLSALLSLGASLFSTGLSVYLVIVFDDSLMGRVVGQYVPFVVLGVCFYLWYWKTGGIFKISYLKYALSIAIPLVVATLGSQILLLGCRIVTQHVCGSDDVAYLSLATTVSQIVIILVNTLNNAWTPWLYDCLNEGKPQSAIKAFRLYIWGISVLATVVILLGPELVMLLGGQSYLSAIWLFPSFMFSCLLGMLANQYIYLETYHKDVWAGGIATLIIGITNLPLCWLLLQQWGVAAVGLANAVSNALLIFAHKALLSKLLKVSDLFSARIVASPLLFAAFAAFGSAALYSMEVNLLRWICVLLLFLCATYVIWKKRFHLSGKTNQ